MTTPLRNRPGCLGSFTRSLLFGAFLLFLIIVFGGVVWTRGPLERFFGPILTGLVLLAVIAGLYRWIGRSLVGKLVVAIAALVILGWFVQLLSVGPKPGPYASTRLNRIAGLGDSYASGEGAMASGQGYTTSFLFNTLVDAAQYRDDPACRRAPTAYTLVLAEAFGRPETLFTACSGAKIDNVVDTPQYPGMKPQLDWLRTFAAVGPVDLVVLQVSGNDQHFGELLQSCAQPNCAGAGAERFWQAIEKSAPQTRQDLIAAIRDIRVAVGRDVPVLVVGYPQILPADLPFGGWAGCESLISFTGAELRQMRAGFTRQNELVRQAAAEAGAYYVDVENAFERHLVCSATPYAHGITPIVIGGKIDRLAPDSFHPTPAGHRCIAEQVLAQFPDPASLRPPPPGTPLAEADVGSARPC